MHRPIVVARVFRLACLPTLAAWVRVYIFVSTRRLNNCVLFRGDAVYQRSVRVIYYAVQQSSHGDRVTHSPPPVRLSRQDCNSITEVSERCGKFGAGADISMARVTGTLILRSKRVMVTKSHRAQRQSAL